MLTCLHAYILTCLHDIAKRVVIRRVVVCGHFVINLFDIKFERWETREGMMDVFFCIVECASRIIFQA